MGTLTSCKTAVFSRWRKGLDPPVEFGGKLKGIFLKRTTYRLHRPFCRPLGRSLWPLLTMVNPDSLRKLGHVGQFRKTGIIAITLSMRISTVYVHVHCTCRAREGWTSKAFPQRHTIQTIQTQYCGQWEYWTEASTVAGSIKPFLALYSTVASCM